MLYGLSFKRSQQQVVIMQPFPHRQYFAAITAHARCLFVSKGIHRTRQGRPIVQPPAFFSEERDGSMRCGSGVNGKRPQIH